MKYILKKVTVYMVVFSFFANGHLFCMRHIHRSGRKKIRRCHQKIPKHFSQRRSMAEKRFEEGQSRQSKERVICDALWHFFCYAKKNERNIYNKRCSGCNRILSLPADKIRVPKRDYTGKILGAVNRSACCEGEIYTETRSEVFSLYCPTPASIVLMSAVILISVFSLPYTFPRFSFERIKLFIERESDDPDYMIFKQCYDRYVSKYVPRLKKYEAAPKEICPEPSLYFGCLGQNKRVVSRPEMNFDEFLKIFKRNFCKNEDLCRTNIEKLMRIARVSYIQWFFKRNN